MSGKGVSFASPLPPPNPETDRIVRLENLVTALTERVTSFEAVLQENAELRRRVAELEARLAATNNTSVTVTENATKAVENKSSTLPWTSAANSSWAQTAARAASAPMPTLSTRKNVSTRSRAAAARAFTPVTGPQGFQYLYLHRSRKMDRPEIRKQLRKLKIDTSRLLDIVFPARSVVGLLFHIQYIPEVTQLLEAAKVAALKDFDPLDPSILADPSLQSLSETERADQAAVIHRQRCLRSLQHIRSTVAPAVARHFIEQGWIDQLDADHVSRSSVGTLFTSSNKDMMTDSDLPNSLAFGTQSQHQ